MQKLIIFLLLFVQQKRRFDGRIVWSIEPVIIKMYEYQRIQWLTVQILDNGYGISDYYDFSITNVDQFIDRTFI